jgi:cyclophilin family peptidyl-prolyl cis-trans isomerase
MKSLRFLFIIFIILSINYIWAQSIARWYTSMGDFEVRLREDIMPITAGNFIDLTNSNFYDDLIFHRVIDNFMIQDGCPLGTGYGGPGYTIPDEYHEDMLFNSSGVLGMAKSSAPNSAGSQYFITDVPYPSLNWNYAAFGDVVEGMDVIQDISVVPTTGENGNPAYKPLVDVVIDSIRIMTASFYGVTPEEDSLFATAGDPLAFGLLTIDPEVTYSWFLDNELQTETNFIYSPSLTVNGSHEIKGIGSKNGYDFYRIWWVEITGGTNSPNDLQTNEVTLFQNSPNPFNPETTISFALNYSENVEIDIFNIKGQHVRTLVQAEYGAGRHNINWNGTDDQSKTVSSGIYFYRLKAGSYTETRRALLLK